MPTRKVSERERLTIYARTATDDQLAEAMEILSIEARIRKGGQKAAPKKAPTKRKPAESPASSKPGGEVSDGNA